MPIQATDYWLPLVQWSPLSSPRVFLVVELRPSVYWSHVWWQCPGDICPHIGAMKMIALHNPVGRNVSRKWQLSERQDKLQGKKNVGGTGWAWIWAGAHLRLHFWLTCTYRCLSHLYLQNLKFGLSYTYNGGVGWGGVGMITYRSGARQTRRGQEQDRLEDT